MRSLLASLFIASALLSTACVTETAQPADTTGGVQEAKESLGTFTSDSAGFDTHSFYYDTGKEVVVFDAQFTPDLAKQLIAQIRKETTSPITYVVITHPNPDKFNGAPEFQKIGAKVVASKATAAAIPDVYAYKKYYFVNVAKSFTDETYPAQASVDITFDGTYKLPLTGGGEVDLTELSSSGVASTQTVAYVPSQKALFVGDLVHHKAHAWLEGGIVMGKPKPDLAGWKKDLGELMQYEGATVYGGRGESAPVADAVAAEDQYLDGMQQIVTDYVAGLGDAKAELGGDKAGDHYQKITDLAVQKFPDYKLSYMVQYSVYGLADQIAGL